MRPGVYHGAPRTPRDRQAARTRLPRSASLAGVVLGVAALREARGTLRAMVGPRGTFVLLAFATLASGFGIYLGRFVRLNSWDALLHPRAVLSDVVPPLLDPVAFSKAWVVTLVFGSLFAVAYLAHPRDERERAQA